MNRKEFLDSVDACTNGSARLLLVGGALFWAILALTIYLGWK